MDNYIIRKGKRLQKGYTTGSCAAGAAKAAFQWLLSDKKPTSVSITLPSGDKLNLDIDKHEISDLSKGCRIIKFAGDDPDATDGMGIWAYVKKQKSGIEIDGGKGVGRVTKPGLKCEVGKAAINPVPMDMIIKSLKETAELFDYKGGVQVVISAENGEDVAAKTFNPKLGIVGGISILGTTGIVEPMSEKALIDTIYTEIDSKAALGSHILLICPGNYGRDFVMDRLGIDFESGVKSSNFIGETLDYALYKGFKKILLAGHAGKLCKLAGGIMNTHSSVADCRAEIFTAHTALAGGSKDILTKIMNAPTTDEIDFILEGNNLSETVWKSITDKIYYHINSRLKNEARAEAVIFTNKTCKIYKTINADKLIWELKGGGE